MSTGYSFGAKTTAAPGFGTGSITFGTPASQPSQQFGFGGLTSTTPSLFSTQPTTTISGFKPTGASFGTPAAGFGGTPAAGFGGTPAAGFGTPATTGTGFGFTTQPTSAPGAGLSFGTPATSTPSASGLGFGAPPANTSLTFGQPAASTGISFGAPASSAPSTGLSFGAPAPAASGGLSFGAPASTGLTFGTATTSTPTVFNGGAYGSAAWVSSLAPGSTLGTATPGPGLSFGAASTAAPTLSFGLTTTSAGTTGGLSFGLGGITSSTAISAAPTTVQPSAGLGGIATSQSKAGAGTVQKEIPPKEQQLPNEFVKLVDDFKNVVQQEKNRSSDVSRCSVKEFHKVESDLDALNHQFNQVEGQLQNDKYQVHQLKMDAARGLQNIEMAQRTQDTPPGLQYDNTAPTQFFMELADEFEREMHMLKTKIDSTDKFVRKCNDHTLLTSQDLSAALKRLHDTFVTLAGRMHSVHSQVEIQKESFLNIRRQIVKDNVNPFEKRGKNADALDTIVKSAMRAPVTYETGPTPFNTIALGSNNLALAAQQKPILSGLSGSVANPQPFGSQPSNTSLLGSSLSSPFSSTNFQLQKPPAGAKRGKQ